MSEETLFYDAMAARYAALSGFFPDEASDISLRLHTLAEQLALFSKRLEHSEQQARVETASGDALDAHAAARGLFRRPAAQAQGILEFTRVQENGLLRIPAGTVCTAADGTEYRTDAPVELAAGTQAGSCSAHAVAAGTRGNAAPQQIARVQGLLAGAVQVRNPAAFTKGLEAETDDALRLRVCADRALPANGANGAFYEREALAFGGISCAVASAAEGTAAVRLLVAADGQDSVPEEVRTALQAALNEKRDPCAVVTVAAAQPVPVAVSLSIEVCAGADFTAVSDALRNRLLACLNKLRIGERLTRAKLGKLVMEDRNIENYALTLPAADVFASAEQVLRSGGITISRMGG